MPLRSRHSILVSVILFFLSACIPTAPDTVTTIAPALPSGLQTPSATRSPIPAAPSRTPTLELTATAAFPSHGPYFAFITHGETGSTLTLLGADASGRKEIPLPEGADTGNCFACIISPDGKRLAYWTGFAGKESYPQQPLDPEAHYDLRLNILNISDGTATVVTDLLTPDYPANFTKGAEAVKDRPDFSGMSIADIAANLSQSFLAGIRSAAWSPDGLYLAFAGEMDGPSSDLYIYDLAEKSIRRLSSGPKNLAPGGLAIQWSPDGKWIVYSSGFLYWKGETVAFFAARPDGSSFREFPDETDFLERWISPSAFILSRSANVPPGKFGSILAELESGTSRSIWPCYLSAWDLDPEKMEILVYQYLEPKYQHCPVGLFFKNLNTGNIRRIAEPDCPEDCAESRVFFLGMGERRYLLYQASVGTYTVSSTGKMSLIQNADYAPVISPDRRWVAFAGKGLRLMDVEGKIAELRTGQIVEKINWRPDTRGFLFNSDTDLFYVSLPDGTVELVGENYPAIFPAYVYWRPDSEGYFFEDDFRLYYVSLETKTVASVQSLFRLLKLYDAAWVSVS